MKNFDIVFVGNSILSVVPALKLKKAYPKTRMAVIGPFQRPHSASIAAGAMHAAFCEVEETFRSLSRDQDIFNIAMESRPLWHEFLAEHSLKEVVTADSTVMYRRKVGTPFEKVNFEAACAVTEDFKCLEEVSSREIQNLFCGSLKSEDVIVRKFIGEFAIDAGDFFVRAQLLFEKLGVTLIDSEVNKVSRISSGGVQISLPNNIIESGRVVVAAGTYTKNILPKELQVVPIYHAVGTSMVLDSAPSTYANLKCVVRTPNRGGAQCGMHIVPRNYGKFFLGAGNYLSNSEPAHRVETIRYLIDTCEQELYGKQTIYNAKASLLLGSRPKSVDGYPVVGSWKEFPELYMASGTYRIGLTIAPVIANEIQYWFENGNSSDKLKAWTPNRALHSYAPIDVATRYYSESRISNLSEHGLLNIEDSTAVSSKKIELENIAKNLNAEIIKKHKLPSDFVVDPDMYGILTETPPQ